MVALIVQIAENVLAPQTVYNLWGALIGVLSSLVASGLFLFFLYSLRPVLEISDNIAKTTDDGKIVYLVKVINRTRGRIYDIHAQIVHIKLETVSGGQNIFATPLTLLKGHIWSVNGIKGKITDTNAEFAVLFVCTDDLDTIWTNETMVEFKIMSKHSFSGFSRIHKKRFYKRKSAIKEGSFKFGDSFEID